jgi:putative FmdB family regulatory protein
MQMPVYEYECEGCGKVHEAIQKFSDPALTECPDCRGSLRKLISSTSFVLKGSGWYLTDYARKKEITHDKKPALPEKPETKTESKPAAEAKTA